jgi:hypothetical protein
MQNLPLARRGELLHDVENAEYRNVDPGSCWCLASFY